MTDPARILLWAEALESGQYVQGRKYLKSTSSLLVAPVAGGVWTIGGNAAVQTTYCCLGVAIEVALANGCVLENPDENFASSNGTLWPSVSKWYGFDPEDGSYRTSGLTGERYVDDPYVDVDPCEDENCSIDHTIMATSANDKYEFTFPQIAAGIRKYYLEETGDGQ